MCIYGIYIYSYIHTSNLKIICQTCSKYMAASINSPDQVCFSRGAVTAPHRVGYEAGVTKN